MSNRGLLTMPSPTPAVPPENGQTRTDVIRQTKHHHAIQTYLSKNQEPVDFSELASRYPDFAVSWRDLKNRRRAANGDRKRGREIGDGASESLEVAEKKPRGGDRIEDEACAEKNRDDDETPKEVGPSADGVGDDRHEDNSDNGKIGYPEDGRESFSTHVDSEFNLALSRALLHDRYDLRLPSLPPGKLCPPIPNRFSYVLWIKHLLHVCRTNAEKDDDDALSFQGMDIGTGASCIYPMLLSAREFSIDERWRILATDVDPASVRSANENVLANRLEDRIHIVLVAASSEGGLGPVRTALRALDTCDSSTAFPPFRPRFDFCMTNPPFFDSAVPHALSRRRDGRDRADMTASEGACAGGDCGFILDMIRDSAVLRDRISWYTSLVGRKETLHMVERELSRIGLGRGNVRIAEFVQGEYQRRWGVAWTFGEVGARCEATKMVGKLQRFQVVVNDNQTNNSINEVVRRICQYCSMHQHGCKLTCTVNDTGDGANVVTIVECEDEKQAIDEKSSVSESEPHPSTSTSHLPKEGHFLIDAVVRLSKKGDTADSSKKGNSASVTNEGNVLIELSCFSHSSRGSTLITKIQSQMEGEVQRSNRRWRRKITKEKGVTTTVTATTTTDCVT